MSKVPDYLKEESSTKQGNKQEEIARKHINSGRVWFDENDLTVKGTNEDYEVDVKKVIKQKGYRLSLEEIDKFFKRSIPKTPIYLIYIGDYVVKASIQRKPR